MRLLTLVMLALVSLNARADNAATNAAPASSAPEAKIEKPGPTNTGPTDPGKLKPMASPTITQDGTVLENVALTGTVLVLANNVTIRNFTLDANGGFYGISALKQKTGLVFEHGEIINYKSAAIVGNGFTATALNIHESDGDGIKAQGPGGGPTLVQQCWIHHIGKALGAHADGDQTVGGHDITFRYNFMDLPYTTPAPYKENSCFILQTKTGPVTNFVIDHNWLNGGGWSIYVPKEENTVQVTNNKFGRDFHYGILDGKPSVFTGNVWEDTGAPVDPGTTRKGK